jgi:hypothetical protein
MISLTQAVPIIACKRTDGLFSVGAGTRIQWDCPEQRNHLALLRRCVTLEVIKDAVQSRSFVVNYDYALAASALQ